ncbi:MAG TPA: geranylgeranyl pyrophosphate synthase [Streptomyces sp.]|nr:geranylgeranyl pyrophosphate synthase [Streptomyces sp.]
MRRQPVGTVTAAHVDTPAAGLNEPPPVPPAAGEGSADGLDHELSDGGYSKLAPPLGPGPDGLDPDSDTALAVESVLAHYLDRRCREAALASDRFAADVAAVVTDLVFRGGKRIRPAFLWWGWRAGGGPATGERAEAALRAAGALELLQACAIVHDDLMDASPLRRGAASAHVAFAQRHREEKMRGEAQAFGASAAILAGDLALVWADDLWEAADFGARVRHRVREPWRSMRTEMVAGQYLDLYGQGTGADSPEAALHVAYLKSGLYTVERPLHLGAVLAGADPDTIGRLRQVGRQTGLAFQLRDDLLGIFGSPAGTGKPAGEDVREGKCTYLMAVALQRARAEGRTSSERRLRASLGNAALTADDLEDVRVLLTDLGAHAAVQQRIERLVGSALHTLHHERFAGPAAERLAALIRTSTACSADQYAHRPDVLLTRREDRA